MAQASSTKSSLRHEVCNSGIDNDVSRFSLSTKPSPQGHSSISPDDLREVTIVPSANHVLSVARPSSTSSPHALPKSSPVESTIVKIPIQSSSPSSAVPKHSAGSSSSIHSLAKRPKPTSRHSSTSSSHHGGTIPANARHSISRQSVFDTLATTLTAVRKTSTSALAVAQQRLSHDNGNLFSSYHGKNDRFLAARQSMSALKVTLSVNPNSYAKPVGTISKPASRNSI